MRNLESSPASHTKAGLIAERLSLFWRAPWRIGDCMLSLSGFAGRRLLIPFAIATLFFAAPMWGAPANDNFAKSVSIGSGGGTVTGSNVDASKQSSEPEHGGNPGGKSVWWSWTASSNASVTVSTAGSDFDTLLGVYTGPNAGNLVTVGSNDDIGDETTSELAFAAVSGTTYRIAVDGWADPGGGVADSGNINLSVTLGGVRPANDDFENAATINSAGGTVNSSNINATRQGGEPEFAGDSGERSIWWAWTPTQSGNALIETTGSSFDTLLGVFTGSSLTNLTLVGENDDAGNVSTSSVVIPVTSGTTYRIAVDGWGGATGSVSLSVQHTGSAPPGNDDFANALTLPGAGGATSGTNVNATKQTGEPDHADNEGGRSVWWNWTAPGDGTVAINTAGSSFDTLLGVYTGASVGALAEVASSDDHGGLFTSRVEFVAISGTTYRIAVDGYGGEIGTIDVAVQFTAGSTPGNDDFANALTIPGAGGNTSGTNLGGTKQTGEPDHGGDAGGHSVWWKWTAPADGLARLSTAGSSFNTLLAVYLGGSVNTLAEVTSSDDDGELITSRVEFEAVSGTTYWIAVDGSGGAIGIVNLSAQFIADSAPQNDAFADALNIASGGANTSGTNVDATKETGEPAHAGNGGGRSIWWKWTAPGNGTATISTASSSFDTLLGVYTGASVGALTEIAASNDAPGLVTSRVEFAATSGTVYRIAVDGWGGATGSVSLSVQFTGNNPPANDAFVNALTFPAEGGNNLGTNVDATKEAGEPVHAGNAGGRSVWWNWTPSLSGIATISTAGSGFDTLLGVYTGASVNSLTVVASSDDHGGTSTSVVEFNAVSGTTYRIAVDGFNDSGAIASGSISLTIVNSVPPATPVTSAATAITTTGFTANWSAASGATGYRLDVSTSSIFANFVTGYQNLDLGNATSRIVSGLSSSVTYYYRVRAYNGSGTSSSSSTITVTTETAPPSPPSAPVASAATSITSTGFTSNWSAASGATGYRLDVSTSSIFANFVSGYQNLDVGNVTNRAVSGLTASTTYYYRVRAASGSGTSSSSSTITVTTATAPPSPPSAPVASGATSVSPTGFTSNWSAASGATGYRLDVSTSSIFANFMTGYQNLDVGNVTNLAVSGLTASTTYYYRVRAYNGSGTSPNSSTITATTANPPAPGSPEITKHPASQTVNTGQPASFTVNATGTAPLSYQWKKGGVDISGVTSATYNVASAATGDAGSYTVVVSNLAGSVTSNAATLTVNTPPALLSHPVSRTAVLGSDVTFSVTASGTNPLAFQWRRDGASIAGATSATLALANVQAANAGAYACVVTNVAGSATSNPATLTIDSTPRIINVSCLASAGAGDSTLVMGFYISGTGAKTLLIRGIGPELADYSVTDHVPDPSITVYEGTTVRATNNDWDPALAADFTRVGAFALNNGSKDAAFKVTLGPGLYTVHLVNSAPVARALIEVYDFSRDSGTRLTNVSCRLNMNAGENVILGTAVIANSRSVLARAVGPKLADYGIPASQVLVDPNLRAFSGQTLIGENDDWELATRTYFVPTGAFDLVDGSKDAALRVVAPTGEFTIHATGKGGEGIALIEIYESP
ncbi:MAG TPA: immunoglobulin domain-containing protein [Opitutaceae bacterium]|nr:immunoglobulin domain-containing protein [Opitutaceae bacterium]